MPYRLAIAHHKTARPNSLFQPLKTDCSKGGYRDSNPGPPEPQSGALTNCAIPTIIPITSCGKSVLEGIRTPDPRLRRPLLYPAELRTHRLVNTIPKRVMGIEVPTTRLNADKKEDSNASSSHRTEIVPNIV